MASGKTRRGVSSSRLGATLVLSLVLVASLLPLSAAHASLWVYPYQRCYAPEVPGQPGSKTNVKEIMGSAPVAAEPDAVMVTVKNADGAAVQGYVSQATYTVTIQLQTRSEMLFHVDSGVMSDETWRGITSCNGQIMAYGPSATAEFTWVAPESAEEVELVVAFAPEYGQVFIHKEALVQTSSSLIEVHTEASSAASAANAICHSARGCSPHPYYYADGV
mmetsp:Transcript_54333/g.115999  ORF Transcript_54333/g.115999 Transcript_54333/m.115999 type:complete len:220 (-) Transcript_54333:262-921(-)